MRFLADESCDASIVRALRAAGHDVTAMADALHGADDRIVLGKALQERRLLLTEDKDFGELVFAAGEPTIGVVLLRHSSSASARFAAGRRRRSRETGSPWPVRRYHLYSHTRTAHSFMRSAGVNRNAGDR